MKRILLTGMSGTGKSSVIRELARLGYKAIDGDSPDFSHWLAIDESSTAPGSPVEPHRDWVWREDRVQALLSTEDADVLFLSGAPANMGMFISQFDEVLLLSAPTPLIVERLGNRTNNPYGKRPNEVARVLDLREKVEPLLRAMSTHEIDTSAPLDEVIEEVLRLVGQWPIAAA